MRIAHHVFKVFLIKESLDATVSFDAAFEWKHNALHNQISSQIVNETSGFDESYDYMPAKSQLMIEWE
jgi:hypothetical protein